MASQEGSHPLSPRGGRTSSHTPNSETFSNSSSVEREFEERRLHLPVNMLDPFRPTLPSTYIPTASEVLNGPLLLRVRDFDPDLRLDPDEFAREQAAFEAFLSSSQWDGGLNYDNAPSHNQQAAVVKAADADADAEYDLEYPPALTEASFNTSSHLYRSPVNFSEDFDFNNLDQPLPISDESMFEFVHLDDFSPNGDDQYSRQTRPEQSKVSDLITPVDHVQVRGRGRDYWSQPFPSPPSTNPWIIPETERHVHSPDECDLPPLNFSYIPEVDDYLLVNAPLPPTQPAIALSIRTAITPSGAATATAPNQPDSDSDYPSWVLTEQDRRRYRDRLAQRRYRARKRAARQQQEEEEEAIKLERERERERNTAIPVGMRHSRPLRPLARKPTRYPTTAAPLVPFEEDTYHPHAGMSHNPNVTSFGITNTPLYRTYPNDGNIAFAYWHDHPLQQHAAAPGPPAPPYSNSPASHFEVRYANAPAPAQDSAVSLEPEVEAAARRAVRFNSPLVTEVYHIRR